YHALHLIFTAVLEFMPCRANLKPESTGAIAIFPSHSHNISKKEACTTCLYCKNDIINIFVILYDDAYTIQMYNKDEVILIVHFWILKKKTSMWFSLVWEIIMEDSVPID
ncbi:hypothetical protein ACJX0J_031829, partial [Zea mays]